MGIQPTTTATNVNVSLANTQAATPAQQPTQSILGRIGSAAGSLGNATLSALYSPLRQAVHQSVQALPTHINNPNIALIALRQQVNDPQDGVLVEALGILRTNLNSRAEPTLRESKSALEAYRSALERHVSDPELLPLLNTLHIKLSVLSQQRALIPQIDDRQWGQLQLYTSGVRILIDRPQTRSDQAQLLQQATPILQTLTRAFNAQRGIVEEAIDIAVEGVNRSLAQVETLPNRIIQNFSEPQAPAPNPAAPAAASQAAPAVATAGAGSSLNLGALATHGRRLLDSILGSARDAASQNAISGLSTVVHMAFMKIKEHIQESHENVHLLNTLDPMIQRLQTARGQSSWDELTRVMGDAFRFVQEQQVYFQGMRVPINAVRTHSSAIPELLQNITAHQNALQSPELRAPQKVTANMIAQQMTLLKSRSAFYGPANTVAEKICGMQCSDAFFAEIFKTSGMSQTELTSHFRQRFFDKLDKTDLNFARRWFAKRTFDFLFSFSAFYINSIFDGVLAFSQKWIQNKDTSQPAKEESMIKLVRNWLAVTSGAYNTVANTPALQSRDFNAMMEQALTVPERNGGLTQDELFASTAKTVLDTFGPKVKWTQSVDHYFKTQIPPTSSLSFFNPLLKTLNIFCSVSLKAVLIIPQGTTNLLLQGGAKIALSQSSFLQHHANHAIESLRRNTPASYSMQCLIYRQMQKILSLIQNSLNDDLQNPNNPLHRDTNIKKVEIQGLVEYAIEVLNKSRYRTQDRLQNYLQHRAPIRDRIEREIEEASLPEIMESAVKTISVAMNVLTQEGEMEQMLYDVLSTANGVFDVQQTVSDEQYLAVEKGNRELIDQVLESAIHHAINEKFDYTNEKQKRGITHFIQGLKDQTRDFSTHLSRSSGEILQRVPLSPTALVSKISTMIEQSTQYLHGRVDALGKADGNRNFHTETKHHLNGLSRELLAKCNPITEKLNAMKSLADAMYGHDKILKSLLLGIDIPRTLGEKAQQPQLSSEDIAFCKIQLSLLQTHLTDLRRNRCPLLLAENLQRSHQEFSSSLNRLKTLQNEKALLQSTYPLFERLKTEKLIGIGYPPSPLLRQLERQICQINEGLPYDQKEQLNQRLLGVMLSQTREAVASAAETFSNTFIQINARNFAHSNQEMQKMRQTKEALQQQLSTSVQEFSHLFTQNKTAIDQHANEIQQKSHELQDWAQRQNELPIWNLFLFDMQWITETVKNLSFDRARAKIQQLFDSIYQRHSYVSFISQVGLLPFLEKFGKHHLKTK